MRCSDCGVTWECDDPGTTGALIDYTGACEQCGSRAVVLDRCAHCPVLAVEHYRSITQAGRLLDRVLDLDFDMKHLHIPWSDVTAEEVMGIKILDQERDKWQRETVEQRRKDDEMQALMERLKNRASHDS